MTSYRYRGRGRRGDLLEGALEAASPELVARQLVNSGITPIEIRESREQESTLEMLRRLRGPVAPDLSELVMLSRQMYTLMRAGVPLNQALAGLAKSNRNLMLREALDNIRSTVEGGRELSGALAMYPKIFSSLYVNTVRIGENTGRLDECFLRLSEYLERERDTRERVKSAMRYPAFVVAAITIAIGVINVVVIPQFASVFARAKVELPLATKILIGTSDFFVAWWPAMVLAAAGAAVWFANWRRTEAGAYRWDGMKLRIPIVGDILYRATLGRFARGFSMALSAGVPLTQALSIMSQAVDNEWIGERIRNVRNGVERGESLARTATATGMFTPLVLQMMTVGEEAGAIDAMLAEVAGFYEREVDYDIRNLTQTIEPLLIAVLAGMVLVFALGVFLPLWDLSIAKLRQ
ncbi:MAG: type II secretion system F family protein [Gammaproteobacteria bacterium]